MDRPAIDIVLSFCELHNAPVQITWDDVEYTADFRSDMQARLCSTMLIAKGHKVKYNPTINGIAYYARLV